MSLFEHEAWSSANLLRQRGQGHFDSDASTSKSAVKLIEMNLQRPLPPSKALRGDHNGFTRLYGFVKHQDILVHKQDILALFFL